MVTEAANNPPANTAVNDPPSNVKKKSSKSKEKKISSVSKPKFKGETSDMNGAVFETAEETKDPLQFVRTLEALERYSYKTYNTDLSTVFDQPVGTTPVISKPKNPEATADEYDKQAFIIRVKSHIAEEKQLLVDLKSLWSVVWGQCSPALVSKLLDEEKIQSWKKSGDVANLLQSIRSICMKYTVRTNPEVNLHKHLTFFYSYRQKESDSIHKYFELFKLMSDGIKNFGGSIGRHDLHIRRTMESMSLAHTSDTHEEYQQKFEALDKSKKDDVLKAAEAKSLAIAFLMGGSPNQYQELILTLQNQYLLKNDLFPSTLTSAYNLMSNYLAHSKTPSSELTNSSSSKVYSLVMAFLQRQNLQVLVSDDEISVSEDDNTNSADNAYSVSNISTDESQSFQISTSTSDDSSTSSNISNDTIGFCFTGLSKFCFTGTARYRDLEDKYISIKSTWILLDTQSNCDIFKNKRLLHDIHEKPGERLILKSNGNGDIRTSLVGNIRGYGEVWFNEQSMANILSFSNVRKKIRVTISTGPDDPCPTFCVHKRDGSIMEFKEHSLGLYVYDAASGKSKSTTKDKVTEPFIHYSFLSNVAIEEQNFSSREISKAKNALNLYRRLGHPSQPVFIRLLQDNLIKDCSVTSAMQN